MEIQSEKHVVPDWYRIGTGLVLVRKTHNWLESVKLDQKDYKDLTGVPSPVSLGSYSCGWVGFDQLGRWAGLGWPPWW